MSIIDTCRSSWNGTKKAHQPDYDELIESYRDMLTARAEAVLATGMCDDGPFAAFEQAVLNAPPEPAASSDQGFEQVTDAEPFYDVPSEPDPAFADVEAPPVVPLPDESLEEVEAARLERAERRKAAQPDKPTPKKKPIRKVAVVVKKVAAKSLAKKPAPKPKVIKKGKK